MEDRHIHRSSIPLRVGTACETVIEDHSIFAVFDGHGGDFTSNYLRDNFLSVLSQRPELGKYAELPGAGTKSKADVTGIQLLKQALVRTFVDLDKNLIPLQQQRNRDIQSGKISPPPLTPESDSEEEYDSEVEDELKMRLVPGERSGSTGIVVIVTPSHYVCANAGDSRAVLRRSGSIVPLSFDHKPSDVPERLRVVAAGGAVKGKRVDGDLAVSRAFGDYTFKQQKELPVEKQRVIVVPDLLVYPRNHEEDEFIVIACDGIWDVASNKQCTDFIQTLLSEGEIDLGNVCEETLDTCLDRNSRDNMTLMLIGLPGIKFDSSSSAVVTNVLWGHRTTRHTKNVSRATINMAHRACLQIGAEFVDAEARFWES